MTDQAKQSQLTKRFVVDSISRENLIDMELCSEEQALALTDQDMTRIADAIGDGLSDGNDAYWETIAETVKGALSD